MIVDGNGSVTERECHAMRLLSHEWSQAELSMTMLCGSGAVRKHVRGECSHGSMYARSGYDGDKLAAYARDTNGGVAADD